jgi:hypothetical protein
MRNISDKFEERGKKQFVINSSIAPFMKQGGTNIVEQEMPHTARCHRRQYDPPHCTLDI